MGLIAQGEVKQLVSVDAMPQALGITRFNQFQGSIKKNGQALGNVVAAQLTYSNNLARIETIRSDGKIEGADPTVASLTGNLEVRFADTDADRCGHQQHAAGVDLRLRRSMQRTTSDLHRA